MDTYHETDHRLRIHDKRQRAQDSDSVDAAVRHLMDTPKNCCCGQGRICPTHGDTTPHERDMSNKTDESKYLPHGLPPEHLEDEADAAREELWGAAQEAMDAKVNGNFSAFGRAANRLENAAIAYGRIYSACQHNTAKDEGWSECPTCGEDILSNEQGHGPSPGKGATMKADTKAAEGTSVPKGDGSVNRPVRGIYRGYRLINHGYYPPDRCVWWEAENIETGEADFRATTRRKLKSDIDSANVPSELPRNGGTSHA